jgi:hypothetical protein
MKRQIRLFGLAVVLLATPALGLVAHEACPPCCEHDADPCEAEGVSCATLSMGACCDVAPVAPTPTAKRMPDTPVAVTLAAAPAVPAIAPIALRRETVHWWMEPSRFSVVRRL